MARFSYAETVVLSHLLHRWEQLNVVDREDLVEGPAERRVIWDLTASLEPVINEVFGDDYASALAGARQEVEDTEVGE